MSIFHFLLEPFAKLETALYEVPALEDASIFPNSMAKAIDEGISKHNLVPPQVERVSSFAKGSLVKSFSTTMVYTALWLKGFCKTRRLQNSVHTSLPF